MKKIVYDSLGPVEVEKGALYGPQTARALRNFNIGNEKMDIEIIKSILYIKMAAAKSNLKLNRISPRKAELIIKSIESILEKSNYSDFRLSIWQTGSGTNTNMNINEVISNLASMEGVNIHPNDDVNASQSSNDVFPSAIHISTVILFDSLFKEMKKFKKELLKLAKKFKGVKKVGRTHMQDAVPMDLSEQFKAYSFMIKRALKRMRFSKDILLELPLGGTAIGTGINAPKNFDKEICKNLSILLNYKFKVVENKFFSISSKTDLLFFHNSLTTLAADLSKIANDIRLLGSGPRAGIGEFILPQNEPGSSIMPGKVNPTQCESLLMITMQIFGNNQTILTASSSGTFELNVAMPVIAMNLLQSMHLLIDGMRSFRKNLLCNLDIDKNKIKNNLENSLMIATVFSSILGYDNTAKATIYAYNKNINIIDAITALNLMEKEEAIKILEKYIY